MENYYMKRVVLTTMCMVYDNDKILVQMRTKKDWPGLTFPGGKVKDNETVEECCIRETYEETGLSISNIEFMGFIEWNNIDECRHFCFLFKTNSYTGTLKSSDEGNVFFIKENEISNYPLSDDFDKIFDILKNGKH